ncbi:putative btb poz-like protein [Neofusicoccum parvum]|uniref:Btb poz-like protein n=1 Tax=Neofusicoccum parvum TaxID=310453 RepID=A0ACB5SDR9_9PEZI|nr:putative btb poz-like protein [Neofusicoccum parvum]
MPADPDADNPALGLKDGMLRHWTSGLRKDDTTDLIIRWKDKEFHVHKIVLIWQCKFFGNALNQIHGFKEARTGVIDMEDDDFADVRALLEYLYTQDYHVDRVDGTHYIDTQMFFHTDVYAIAEKYDVPKLKRLAASKFALTLDDKNRGYEATDFPCVVARVYNTTPASDRGLRDIVIKVCRAHQQQLMADRSFLEKADKTCGVWKDFTRELLGLNHGDPVCYICPGCDTKWDIAVKAKRYGSQNRAEDTCDFCKSVLVKDNGA